MWFRTYFVVPYLGGIGAALCSCIAYLVGQGVIMNIYYYRVTKIIFHYFGKYWKDVDSTWKYVTIRNYHE